MAEKNKKISIDALIEAPGGDLVFKEVKASKRDLKELVAAKRNPVIKHNLFRPGSEKKVRVE